MFLEKNKNQLFCAFSAICIIAGNAGAQLMEEGEIAVYASYMAGGIKNKSFNTFADSYSGVNASDLEKPMSGFRTATGVTFGVRSMYGSLNYTYFQGTAQAVFKNGDKRLIKNTIMTPINVGLPIMVGRVFIHPKFGFAETTLDISYKYANGIESVGNETTYSGQYHTFGFYFGLDLAYSQPIGKRHRIELGMSGHFLQAKRNEYSDFSHGRSMGLGYYPTSLPLDVVAYGPSGTDYLSTDKGFVNGQSTFFSAYIAYSFIIFKDN